MKSYLFNTLKVTMIATSRKDLDLVRETFFSIAGDLGYKLQCVHRPATNCNMRLEGGDESDFNTLLEMTREFVSDTKLKGLL